MARKIGSRSEITGPAIRRAAEGLFARHGYAAVSMRQIAAEVGLQVGAIYVYTPDKQTLLFELMRDHLLSLLATKDSDAGELDPLARLDAFVRGHVGYHFDRRDAVFLAYMELRNLTPENFEKIEALRRAYEDRLEGILVAGRAANVMQFSDSRVVTMALIAMLAGVHVWFRDGGRLSREEVEEMYADLALRMVSVQ